MGIFNGFDWNLLIPLIGLVTILGTIVVTLHWLVKPITSSIGVIQVQIGEIRTETGEIRKDVKQNGERIARIEGIIWADIDKFIKKTKGEK